MKKKEIKKRIEELTGRLAVKKAKEKRGIDLSIFALEGEISGLEWVLKYWDGYYEKV